MQTNCPKCNAVTEETDNFCRRCGRSLRPGTGFFYTHSGVIVLTLLLGPFALIPLWMSKLIGQTAKIIYTVVILAFTAYGALAFWRLYQLMNEMIQYSVQGLF